MDYSTFSENPNLYFMSILLAMAITLLAYGAGPLLFALIWKKPILKKRFRLLCILYTITVAILFMALRFVAGDNVGTFAPALIWGIVFYKIGGHILRSKGRLSIVEMKPPENLQAETSCAVAKVEPAPIVEVYRSNFKLPQEREKNAGKNYFKMGFFIMLAVLVCLSSAFVWLYSNCSMDLEEAEKEISSLQEKIDSNQNVIRDLRQQIDELESDYYTLRGVAQDTAEASAMLNSSIGFIVDGSPYYHNYWCDTFQNADEYWAHNIEYCAYIGYSPCPYCW